MSENQERSKVATAVSVLLTLAFLGAGGMKLSGAPEMIANFEKFGFGVGMMYFIGAAEVAGAIGLWLPRLAPLAASGLAIIMVGGTVVHLMHDPFGEAVPPAVLFILLAYVASSRWGELRG